MNIFADIAKGFKWLGKALNTAVVWVPKIVKITEDVSADAEQLMPQATQVLVDVDSSHSPRSRTEARHSP